mmetsp:Transcript_15943/g.29192  ORF Transcript_15943/g.29192 Transcript_15943/m.29192 type:complete len:176 (+) Transcript_15943:1557-2084(+)
MQKEDERRILTDLVKQREHMYLRKYCPVFKPEHGTYEVKTRPPLYTYNWRLNYLRRARDQELSDEAKKAARLKCFDSANTFTHCTLVNPRSETTECKAEFKIMQTCMGQEYLIEIDKRRRDMTRNTEWWWQNIYDEDGEVGTQALTPEDTYVEKTVDFAYAFKDWMDKWVFRRDV